MTLSWYGKSGNNPYYSFCLILEYYLEHKASGYLSHVEKSQRSKPETVTLRKASWQGWSWLADQKTAFRSVPPHFLVRMAHCASVFVQTMWFTLHIVFLSGNLRAGRAEGAWLTNPS